MSDFFKTPMGKKFYEGTMPRIADALTKIAESMEEESQGIETSQFKDPYIRLEVPGTDLTVHVKLDEEGVAVDFFNKKGECLPGTQKLYQEMAEG